MSYGSNNEERELSLHAKRAKILAELREVGVKTVHAEYSGSNDEGYVDDVELEPSVAVEADVADFLSEFVYEAYPGYEINDGACGTVTWHVDDNRLIIMHNERYTMLRPEKTEFGEDGSIVSQETFPEREEEDWS